MLQRFSQFLVFVVIYYGATRIPRSWKGVLLEYPVITHAHEVKEDWPLRLFCGLVLLLFWGLGFYFLKKRLNLRAPLIKASAWIFANLGFGLALALIASIAKIDLPPFICRLLVLLPLVLSTFALKRWPKKEIHLPRFQLPNLWLKRAAIFCACILFIRALSQFWYSFRLKPTGAWDETWFWWPCVDYMSQKGITEYFTSFGARNYDPAYPILVPSILLPVNNAAWINAASNFAGFFFGLATLTLLVEHAARGYLAWKNFVWIAFVYALVVLSQGGWITVLQWRPGNGDGFAALAATLLFLQIYSAGHMEKIDQGPWLYSSFGLGILAQLIKPPLATLIIPLLILFLAADHILSISAKLRRPTALACLGGAVLGKILWALCKKTYHLSGSYDVSASVFSQFEVTAQGKLVLGLFVTDYRVQFIIFFIFGLLALLRRSQRKLLPAFGISLGLIFSIVWLYLTYWKTTEHESAGRYFTHGLLAWIWLFALSGRRLIFASLRISAREIRQRLLR